ncbi:hypothetical protein TrVE_jg10814 [Triparma verrucosa]|uniref:Uncharacterized protein n=1 Tax=Triparma verrucosa TaxID=1606542 RepID=A0A9W7BSL5_9STRA|nr:hypothetical protein TrVE_jg10814 [Triparma verrucosa]
MLLLNPNVTALRECTLQSVKKYKRQNRQSRSVNSPTSNSPQPLTDYSESLAQQIHSATEKTDELSILVTNEVEWIEFHRDCLAFELRTHKKLGTNATSPAKEKENTSSELEYQM